MRGVILKVSILLAHYVDTYFIITVPGWPFLSQSAVSKLISAPLLMTLFPWNQYGQTVCLTGAQNAKVKLRKSLVLSPEKFNFD